jgi:hypothetical protein
MGPIIRGKLASLDSRYTAVTGRTGLTNCHYRDEYDEIAQKSPSQLNAISSHFVTIPSQKKVALSARGLLPANQAKRAKAAATAYTTNTKTAKYETKQSLEVESPAFLIGGDCIYFSGTGSGHTHSCP